MLKYQGATDTRCIKCGNSKHSIDYVAGSCLAHKGVTQEHLHVHCSVCGYIDAKLPKDAVLGGDVAPEKEGPDLVL